MTSTFMMDYPAFTEESVGYAALDACRTLVSPHPDPLPRGGEHPPPGAWFAHTGLANSTASMAQRRRAILPLPKGEGRGGRNVAHPTAPVGSFWNRFNRVHGG